MDIFFCPLRVLPVTDVLFVQLRILVFDCEGLFKSFDNSNLDVPIKYQYFFNIMLKKNSKQMSTYCPKYCSRRDTHTVGTSPTNPRVQENY